MIAASRSPNTHPTDSVREAAALWFDRLTRDNVSEETRASFARWLEEAPEHRAAYEAVERTWALAQSEPHDPQILALRHETALRLTRKPSLWMRAPGWVAATIVLVIMGGALGIALWPQFASKAPVRSADSRSPAAEIIEEPRARGLQRYATAIGERLAVTLEDGSQVTLNTQTALEAAFSLSERRILLTQGQALFEVTKDPIRPFVVEARGRRLVALGTAFDVRIEGERVQVTMIEGSLRVERTEPNRGTVEAAAEMSSFVTTLTAGEQLTVDARQLDRVRIADAERVTSWRHGQLIFENSRLGDAVTELNRYSKTKIQLADPALGDLRISGAFVTGRPTVFVEALSEYFPITVTRADDQVVVLSARD